MVLPEILLHYKHPGEEKNLRHYLFQCNLVLPDISIECSLRVLLMLGLWLVERGWKDLDMECTNIFIWWGLWGKILWIVFK
jgi:hypothetical protein